MAVKTSAEVTPPPRPNIQTVSTDNALYFADASSVRMFMQRKGPFDRLKTQRLCFS